MDILRNEIEEHLKRVQGWVLADGSIEKEYEFKDFKEAIGFINKVADAAERENHHPNILLHNWNKVKLTLTTHAVGGLSEKDFSLALRIDETKLR